jgi:hypothetical protein
MFGGVRKLLLDPRDVKKDASMRAAATGFDFIHDTPRHVIAGEKLGRAPSVFVALRIASSFLRIIGGL